jgi:Second Messenger Oligonucleotide or Dinucleotide Synthetase domain
VPTTIPSSFLRLRSNLEITSLQLTTVSTRQLNVRNAVARHLTVNTSFVTGSYKRHTMISPLNQADVDVFVVLDPTYYTTAGYATLLDRVRGDLIETYPQTSRISRNGQAVSITFNDFVVDVVPAFHRRGGGFLIPSTTQSKWISTDPTVHEAFVTNANQSHGGDLVPLIKMVKAWNRNNNRPFRSFYLELLVEKALRDVVISNDWSGCRYVFDVGRDLIKRQIIDPAGLDSGQVPGFAGVSSVTGAVRLFQVAYDRAVQAENFASIGRIPEAVTEWRKVFGDYFPAYG